MPVFPQLREQLTGRGGVRMSAVPSWSHALSFLHPSEKTQLDELNTLFADQLKLLRDVRSAWERGDFATLNRCLQDCSAYCDPNKPHLLTYFVGLGGIDLFVRILCDVDTPTRKEKQSKRYSPLSMDAASRAPWELQRVLHSLLRLLTELLVCHNELAWYFYDQFPGLFFRLLEFAKNKQLNNAALVMLEHLVLSVGPVLEIAKTPLLQELIRTEDSETLAILCRVLALLIMPAVMVNQHESPHPPLTFPESLLPLRRVQRVVGSNVLWLIGEKGLVQRLVALCEVRGAGNVGRGSHNEGFTGESDPTLDAFQNGLQPLMDNLATPVIPPYNPSVNMGYMTVNFVRALRGTRESGATPYTGATARDAYGDGVEGTGRSNNRGNNREDDPSANNGINSNNNNMNSDRDYLYYTYAPDEAIERRAEWETWNLPALFTRDDPQLNAADVRRTPDWMSGGGGGWGDDDAVSAASGSGVSSGVDFSWFVGVTDVKQRWRLRDLTLREEEDDSRPLLSGFGPVTDCDAREEFRRRNRAYWELLGKTASDMYDVIFNSHMTQTIGSIMDLQRQEAEWCHLPRFLHTDGVTNAAMIGTTTTAKATRAFSETVMMGEDTEAYTRNTARFNDDDDDALEDVKDHEHDPATIRRLELLRSVQEFWNAQDRRESTMLLEGDTAMHSIPLARKIAVMLKECSEDCCLETSACHVLESFLRCFSKLEDGSSTHTPQSIIGDVLLRSILEQRVYNATYMPELCGSLVPAKRIDNFFALLGEMIRYHYENLCILNAYVMNEVDLRHLNEPASEDAPHLRRLRGASPQVEQLLRAPPLDRDEFEPFVQVLLRRAYRHGCNSNLFLRSLLLSLTPGLRSRVNYIWKPVTSETIDAKDLLVGTARVDDVVTGHPNRLHYINRHSRRFVSILSERRRRTLSTPACWGPSTSSTTTSVTPCVVTDARPTKDAAPPRGSCIPHNLPIREVTRMTPSHPPTHFPFFDPTADATGAAMDRDMTLWEMLQRLLHAPHRLPRAERPIPDLLDATDRALVEGEMELLPVGPPPSLYVPLFGTSVSEAEGLRALRGLEASLLAEPHRLVYSMLGPLNAERFRNAGRLCVVTTSIFVFVRAARCGGASGVHAVLRDLRLLAEPALERWRRRRHAATQRMRRSNRRSTDRNNGSRACQEGDGSARCEAFRTYGHCAPMCESEWYYQQYGGCFFRNMFRLLCVWIGHYGACQRYMETLYYCTEVPFAEPKCVVLYLMRVLPDYFFEL